MKHRTKKKLKLKSVNVSLYGYFCLLSVLLIMLVDVVFYLVVSSALSEQAHRRVLTAGKDMVNAIDSCGGDDPFMGAFILKGSINRYREEGLEVFILNPDGSVILPADAELSDERFGDLSAKLAGVEEGGKITYSSYGFVSFSARVNLCGEKCMLLVSCPLTVVRQTVTAMQFYLLLISGIALLLALLISYSFSQKLTRGLQFTSDTAVKLAHGDYSVSFTNADYRELARLSDTLNYVRDEVKKSRDFQMEILANVTHDLKTPLTMIKAYASMVKEISGDDPEKRNKHLQVIIDESDRLTGLVNDILAVSKVNANLGDLNLGVFNLTEFLYGILNKFGYLGEQGYTFMADAEPNLYTRADREKIEQVIYNLLGNAVNYTGDDKTVYVSLKSNTDGTRARLSVRDTGKGIPKEELSDIWERYYRSRDSHTRPVTGTGLGLSIVKLILEAHSFDYGVESEPGSGTVFWVDFPSVSAEITEEGQGKNG